MLYPALSGSITTDLLICKSVLILMQRGLYRIPIPAQFVALYDIKIFQRQECVFLLNVNPHGCSQKRLLHLCRTDRQKLWGGNGWLRQHCALRRQMAPPASSRLPEHLSMSPVSHSASNQESHAELLPVGKTGTIVSDFCKPHIPAIHLSMDSTSTYHSLNFTLTPFD